MIFAMTTLCISIDMDISSAHADDIWSNLESEGLVRATYDTHKGPEFATICWNERTVLNFPKNGDSYGYVEYSISIELTPQQPEIQAVSDYSQEQYDVYDDYGKNHRRLNFVTIKSDDKITVKENRTFTCRSSKDYTRTLLELPLKKRVEISLKSSVEEENIHPANKFSHRLLPTGDGTDQFEKSTLPSSEVLNNLYLTEAVDHSTLPSDSSQHRILEQGELDESSGDSQEDATIPSAILPSDQVNYSLAQVKTTTLPILTESVEYSLRRGDDQHTENDGRVISSQEAFQTEEPIFHQASSSFEEPTTEVTSTVTFTSTTNVPKNGLLLADPRYRKVIPPLLPHNRDPTQDGHLYPHSEQPQAEPTDVLYSFDAHRVPLGPQDALSRLTASHDKTLVKPERYEHEDAESISSRFLGPRKKVPLKSEAETTFQNRSPSLHDHGSHDESTNYWFLGGLARLLPSFDYFAADVAPKKSPQDVQQEESQVESDYWSHEPPRSSQALENFQRVLPSYTGSTGIADNNFYPDAYQNVNNHPLFTYRIGGNMDPNSGIYNSENEAFGQLPFGSPVSYGVPNGAQGLYDLDSYRMSYNGGYFDQQDPNQGRNIPNSYPSEILNLQNRNLQQSYNIPAFQQSSGAHQLFPGPSGPAAFVRPENVICGESGKVLVKVNLGFENGRSVEKLFEVNLKDDDAPHVTGDRNMDKLFKALIANYYEGLQSKGAGCPTQTETNQFPSEGKDFDSRIQPDEDESSPLDTVTFKLRSLWDHIKQHLSQDPQLHS